jgi:hypothetical protein
MHAAGGDALQRIANQAGLDEGQAASVLKAVAPALGQGLSRQAASPSGLEALLGALASGNHRRYVDDPATLTRPETVTDGNAILGHILGSKDVSRAVAGQAATQTGVSPDIIKQMLPLLASLAMGALSQKQATAPATGQAPDRNLLTSLLDGNGDGSIADDLLGMASKMFKR